MRAFFAVEVSVCGGFRPAVVAFRLRPALLFVCKGLKIEKCTYVSRVWLLDVINNDRKHSLCPLAASCQSSPSLCVLSLGKEEEEGGG